MRGATDAGALHVGFEADHEALAPLIVVADLATADEAVLVRVAANARQRETRAER